MNTNQSILKGAIALAGIILFQSIFSFLVRKSSSIKKIVTNNPMALMYQGKILYQNLDKTNIGEGDLVAKLREANVLDFDEVLIVVLESTGDMSVLHSAEKDYLPSNLLKGVDGLPDEVNKNNN
jgi:uncharacterized membrane protein YcaP (DUF421 family)